ncbi:hypothetical protein AAFP35_22120 [Gordonia sp. CPCC 206044]|uniref:hypothetical protein n=1 Tax=Gordonia sp. CPCC 206044 TaxID=3140793 RepID=UPI003AF39913
MTADDPQQPDEHRVEGESEQRGPISHPREWRHIYKTRIRTSTALLVAAFLGCVILYGYTSQRYGVVAAPSAPTRVSTSTTPSTTTPLPSSTTTTTSTSTTPSTTQTSESGTDETGGAGEQGATTGDETTTAPNTIPGLPGVTLPNFGATPQTGETTAPPRTSVPQR